MLKMQHSSLYGGGAPCGTTAPCYTLFRKVELMLSADCLGQIWEFGVPWWGFRLQKGRLPFRDLQGGPN